MYRYILLGKFSYRPIILYIYFFIKHYSRVELLSDQKNKLGLELNTRAIQIWNKTFRGSTSLGMVLQSSVHTAQYHRQCQFHCLYHCVPRHGIVCILYPL
jgi:hypothetical protein